jgi:hypothetical protein
LQSRTDRRGLLRFLSRVFLLLIVQSDVARHGTSP